MTITTLKKLSSIYGIGTKSSITIHKKIGINVRKQPTKLKSIHQGYLKKIAILENTDQKLKSKLLDRINFYKRNKIKTNRFIKKTAIKNVIKNRKRP